MKIGLADLRYLRFCSAGCCLPELYSPLVERIDSPDYGLHIDAMLVEGDQRTQRCRREPLRKQCAARAIALEAAMGRQMDGYARGESLVCRSAERERLTLRKQVGH